MAPRTEPTATVEAATLTRLGKQHRRPTTGRAEAYRKAWGREWGDFAKTVSRGLHAGSEGAK